MPLNPRPLDGVPARAKVMATVGPSCASPDMIERMVRAGVRVFRLNMSHTSHDEVRRHVAAIRAVEKKLGVHVAIHADLAGPKIRTGKLEHGAPVTLKRGATFTLTTRRLVGDRQRVSVTYRKLPRDVKKGQSILLDDGELELVVTRTTDTDVVTRVVVGGMLAEDKGVNLPDTVISDRAPTAKDRKDLTCLLDNDVDIIGLSFVQGGQDVKRLRRAIEKRTDVFRPIVAKIERAEAVANLDEIMAACEVVMVARGDLGVEMPYGELPIIQKAIIDTAARHGRIDITATQMLESMRYHPRPSRAEATDVANAVLDGTDCIMLAGETAVGDYPAKTVETAIDIIRRTEASRFYREACKAPVRLNAPPEIAATVRAACAAAEEVDAAALAVFTHSGRTAMLVAELRPACPIVALTDHDHTARRLALVWGTTPVRIRSQRSLDGLIRAGRDALRQTLRLRRNDTVIYVAGSSLTHGAANFMLAETL